MRKIIGAKPFANQTFQVVGGKIGKASVVLKNVEVFCKDEISAQICADQLHEGKRTPTAAGPADSRRNNERFRAAERHGSTDSAGRRRQARWSDGDESLKPLRTDDEKEKFAAA